MSKKFQEYTLADFLDDADFCAWVKGERADLNSNYDLLLSKFPSQKNNFNKARQLFLLFTDKNVQTSKKTKIQKWEKTYNIYLSEKKKSRFLIFSRYAAIFVMGLLISAISFFLFHSPNNSCLSSLNIQNYSETTLSLSNSREISVSGNQSTIECLPHDTKIKIDGKLISLKEGEENQLIVPFGKQSKIVLSDGSAIWLNAGSILIFPSTFNNNKRNVKILGEAYFEVAKDHSKPFTVTTQKSKIKVLGTRFNVKSIPNAEREETTLLEGSISLTLKDKLLSKDILLKPEEQILIEQDNTFSKSHVDINHMISWREGILVFNDEPLSAVLNVLSSFYGITIKCDDEAAADNKKIRGKLDLKRGQQQALKSLGFIVNGEYIEQDTLITLKLKPM